mmetsp:Transcript_6565/g.17016  ORF Transcript_6565/g.17016 Transcript_6565/m.17016 type:complete len:512 (-) Transcript_6565:818-2353(-)
MLERQGGAGSPDLALEASAVAGGHRGRPPLSVRQRRAAHQTPAQRAPVHHRKALHARQAAQGRRCAGHRGRCGRLERCAQVQGQLAHGALRGEGVERQQRRVLQLRPRGTRAAAIRAAAGQLLRDAEAQVAPQRRAEDGQRPRGGALPAGLRPLERRLLQRRQHRLAVGPLLGGRHQVLPRAASPHRVAAADRRPQQRGAAERGAGLDGSGRPGERAGQGLRHAALVPHLRAALDERRGDAAERLRGGPDNQRAAGAALLCRVMQQSPQPVHRVVERLLLHHLRLEERLCQHAQQQQRPHRRRLLLLGLLAMGLGIRQPLQDATEQRLSGGPAIRPPQQRRRRQPQGRPQRRAHRGLSALLAPLRLRRGLCPLRLAGQQVLRQRVRRGAAQLHVGRPAGWRGRQQAVHQRQRAAVRRRQGAQQRGKALRGAGGLALAALRGRLPRQRHLAGQAAHHPAKGLRGRSAHNAAAAAAQCVLQQRGCVAPGLPLGGVQPCGGDAQSRGGDALRGG